MEREEDYTIYNVETDYKSGRTRSEYIAAKNEEDMWKIYDKRHKRRKNLIDSSAIIDAWMQ